MALLGILIYVLEASSLKGSELFVAHVRSTELSFVQLYFMYLKGQILDGSDSVLIPNVQNGLTTIFFAFLFAVALVG
jgi:hypothetical protein